VLRCCGRRVLVTWKPDAAQRSWFSQRFGNAKIGGSKSMVRKRTMAG
jgi:hypothetical protein